MNLIPKLTIASNATPEIGGQGMNLADMIAGLRDSFDVTTFCKAPVDGVTSVVVPSSRGADFILKTRGLRRYRDWGNLISDLHFDNYVASRMPEEVDIFQSVSGHSF